MATGISPAILHILLVLAEGKRHGYAIADDISELSDGRVRLGPASLYGTLQRLMNLGWIEPADAPRNVDERRRYYQLTNTGRAVLRAEIRQMETLVRKARAMRPRTAAPKS